MTGFLLCGLWPDYGRIVVFAITSVLMGIDLKRSEGSFLLPLSAYNSLILLAIHIMDNDSSMKRLYDSSNIDVID